MDYYDPKAKWELIPEYMREPVRAYVMEGGYIGDFLANLLEGRRFLDVVGAADDANLARLFEWAQFVRWHIPALAHGTPERVAAWQESGGINGQRKMREG